MSRLIPISPHKLDKILIKLGFESTRHIGSHKFYQHTDGRYTTVPFHGNREIAPPLLQKILKEIKVSREEYQKFL